MSLVEGIRTALDMIRAHRLRAFFTVLGTVMGVTFLIAVITLINGMDAYMKEDLGRKIAGLNTVTLRREPRFAESASLERRREVLRRPPLTQEDAEWLSAHVQTPGVLAVSSEGAGQVRGPDGRALDNVRLRATSASYFTAFELGVARGRVFTRTEAARGVAVAVIGSEVAERLFRERSAVGGRVRLRNVPYRVVGVLEDQGTVLGFSFDQVVVVPARSPLGGVLAPRNTVGEIVFRAAEAPLVGAARGEIEGLMRVRHGLRPAEPSDFDVSTSESALGMWNRVAGLMLVALPGLVGISLVVGAVVIMNIMLVSVTERTREIGLRKSVGARSRDILWQFLVEAGTLSGAGGVLGIGLGVALAAVVSAVSPLPARVAPWSVGLAVLLGVGVGLCAGGYPAYRAARLHPVDALRRE